jgi:hypothetical protein
MTEPAAINAPTRTGARLLEAMAAGLVVLAAIAGFGALAGPLGLFPAAEGPEATRLTEVLSQTIDTEGIDAAVERYRALRAQGFPRLVESESDTNRLGYALLKRREMGSALRIFQLNAETYPRSANVHDSLGEAYLAAGDEVEAVESYRRALAIAPQSRSAANALEKLTDFEREPYRPLTLFHIGAGALGLFAGAAAVSLRKGSRRHGVAGTVFSVAMLSMSASGAYLAYAAPEPEVINVLMGFLAFYLVATAWSVARRKHPGTGPFDWIALLAVVAVGIGLATFGLAAASSPAGSKDGIPAGLFFGFAAVALLAGAGDLRRIARGGIAGARRTARHLWRMCCALFIAVSSLFLGQPQLFPQAVRDSGLLAVPSVVVVILLVFWLVRVLSTSAREKKAVAPTNDPLFGRLIATETTRPRSMR